MRTALRAATVAALVLAPVAVPAAASAASTTGTYTCPDLGGDIQITTHDNHSSEHGGWGVGLTDTGHLIPVSFSFSAYDVTTQTTLFEGSSDKGGGHANHNQPTVTCTQSMTDTLANLLEPGDPVPDGVALTDTVTVTFSVDAVVK